MSTDLTVAPSQQQFSLAGDPARANPAVAERLARAREMAGYATPGAAIAFRRWNSKYYLDHEAGRRIVTPEDAKRYASGYRVSARWLLLGA